MLAVPTMSGNVITLTPVNGRYDPNLPVRLNGIISAEDFRDSIRRCNSVCRRTMLLSYLSQFITLGGIIAGFALCISAQIGFNFGLFFVGMGVLFGSVVFGQMLRIFVLRQAIGSLNQAVQAEHVRYATPVPGRPPVSWSLNQPSTTIGWNMRVQHVAYNITIEIGSTFQGAPFTMGQQFPYGQGQPIVYSAANPPQPQYQPYQQPQAQAQVQVQAHAHPPPFQSYPQPPPQLPPPSYDASPPATSPYAAFERAAPVKPLELAPSAPSAPSAPPYGPLIIPSQDNLIRPLQVCPSCERRAAKPEDKFCAHCGSALLMRQ